MRRADGMTMQDPIVDVLIPVFNGAAFIRSSVESIQNQTLSALRIHVVNDGSTDATGEILSEMAARDDRIRIHTKPNGGIVEALNLGLAQCTAEFIARHDADDLAFPDRLALQIALLRERPEVVATASSARHIDTRGEFMGTIAHFAAIDQANPRSIPAKEPYLLHPFLTIRRAALLDAGGYRHVIHAEDSDLYWRLEERGCLYNDPRVLGEYRMHPDSISSQSVRNGRVMAVSSQLCALSAVRRRAGSPDLAFNKQDGGDLKAASDTLEEACRVGCRELSADEARHLRFAASIKLLETAAYRPYELEMADCVFIKSAFRESESFLEKNNRALVARSMSGTAARMAAKGRWREAGILLEPNMRMAFLVRLAIRVALPLPAHRRVRRAFDPILKKLRSA